MVKIFGKTIQHFNILIEDKAGNFLLTKPLPYKPVEFPNEGLMNYINQKKIPIQKQVNLLRYKHKVSKKDSTLDILATFWVKSQKDVNLVKQFIKGDIIEGNDSQIQVYIDLIKQNIFVDQSIFAWEGQGVELKHL